MAEIQVHEPAAARTDGGGPKPAGSDHTHDSLFKNAYFLMLSTGVSAVLGLGFWLVAARYYTEEAVGQGSAAIAAMRLLASITATTMIGAVVRFVPRAGRETGRLVWGMYVASSLVVALAAAVFLLTLDAWGASYAPLGTPMAGAVFVAACVAWALLTLQDGVLTGLRKAEWVPAGNAVFSVGKLALLAVFAGTLPVLGIFVSWAAAIAFSTLPLGWLIFRRLIPRQAETDRDKEPPKVRDMGRFLAGDSLGALFSLAMINLLPVMVAVRFSAAENGYFYVAYTVGGTMEFMAINMASSLTAHASHDPRQLADGVRGALRRMTLLLVPVVAVLVVFAPYILTPFSPDYAEHGSTVLRLLALGALPRVVVELYIGVLRVQGRTGVLAALQGAMCALVLGCAAVLFTPAGIAGAGWAVLLSMTLIAVVSMAGLRAALRHDDSAPPARTPAAPAYGTHWAKLNATAGYGTTWARRAAYQPRDGDQDTVTLFIGRPGYEREALQADTLALIVRPEGPTREPPPHEPGEPEQEPQERRLRGALWSLLAVACLFFLAPLRDLPWLDGVSRAALTGRRLLEGLPLPSLTAGGLLLVVFVAAVTLSTRRDPWLPGTALAAALLALYAAPVALGREPRPVDGALYEKTAGFLADALGLDGPEPLLRWAPPACQLLCLVPLGLLLARAGGRLTWPGRWGVLYLVAVGGWVWRDALAPLAPPLLVALALLLLLHRAASAWARSRTTAPPGLVANRRAGGPPTGPPRD
ncbi:Membrane protein involved in the export of O-antigen and teichoic acid [Streptomyces sp. Ag82_O1-12]|uniref:lipopolysaccharide biosynthesis protein n=1 Tax=unclassified Streptomyces TaxID=2593676 RepID=UPI000BD556D5|nr:MULTISPECIES: lipopolysaccharide biosynthesis protein [unclassified Streptomyces]SMQ18200.1 Membrane protein involved in the export of O-antigen and teichoic acid [Streptomyces sp. Ag82_O1-12]SOD47238.1 Membrane protein involved in the export of O-antigen and teichoic acid [Streptomyces sp. Ag82_G6-1]